MSEQKAQIKQFENAIAQLEAQRAILGDAVVDASIVALRDKLAALSSSPQEKGTVELHGERRQATILLADVKGSTELAEQVDTEIWVEIMNRVFHLLGDAIYAFGGEIDQYRGDGLVAFFGAKAAHEDDPERAVRAALAMQEAVKRYAAELKAERGIELLLRIGINSGEVIAAEVGDRRQHSEDTAMGRAIALAARMESAAQPGTVLVTANTYRLTRPLFEWQALGEITVKGVSQPVTVYRPLVAHAVEGKGRGIEGLSSPLVGRDEEMNALRQAIGNLQRGVGGIVTLVGEAGIGKSRLVTELRKQTLEKVVNPSQGLSVQWVEGHCLSYGGPIAYLPWLDMLRRVLNVTPDAPALTVRDALHAQVQALCPDCFDEVYPYLARLMSLPLEDEYETIRNLQGESLRAEVFWAMQTLVERAARQRPLVMVFEDLHWADATSLALLERVLTLTDRVPLLVLCVFRPEREHSCWQLKETVARLYHHRYADLWLDALSADESQALVGNLLRVEDLPDALRAKILDHAEGNPFYVEEILRTLINDGAIIFDESSGHWGATREITDIPIPDTLHGVLTARIDRLEEETRRVLRLASVIGRVFFYRVLAEIAKEEQQLDTRLLTLQRQQLIRERARLPELQYIFKHELTREAAYNGLLKRERQFYHRQVAETLERLSPEQSGEQLGLLAHHWQRAQEPRKAVEYLLRAGDYACRQGASLEAVDFFLSALQGTALLSTSDRAVQQGLIHERLGDLYLISLSRQGDALEHYSSFLSLTTSVVDTARGMRKVGRVHLLRGELTKGQQLLEMALARLSNLPPVAEASRIHHCLAYLFISRNQMDRALKHADTVLEISRQVGDVRGLADATGTKAAIAVRQGKIRAACEYQERVSAIYLELGDLPRIARNHNNLGNSYRLLGQMDRALERLVKGLEIARRIGDTREESLLLETTGEVFLDRGQWESAITRLEQALSLAQESGVTARTIATRRLLGLAHEGAGHWQDAQYHLEMAEMQSLKTQLTRYLPRIYLDLAHFRATQGEFDEALKCIHLAVESVEQKPSSLFSGLVQHCLGYVHSRRGDWDSAVECLEKGLELLKQTDCPVESAKVHLSLGIAYASRGDDGDKERACERLSTSLATFRQIDAGGYLAQAVTQMEVLECRDANIADKSEHTDMAAGLRS
jgi:class 3 adenylate cyclase/tetratricopeptide (TPR) repeat protein